jgi:glycosyltransferase involved in cell wall biosynthesis
MPRLLAVGPALDQSSYARVVHSTLAAWPEGWEIRQIAVNHRGGPADAGWRILPNPNIGDRYAIEQIAPAVSSWAPDAIFVFNSFLSLPRYWRLPSLLGDRRPLLVAQCPMLGEAVDAHLVGRLAFFDCVVVLSEVVRRHMAQCFETCLRDGSIDRIPILAVIPHGIDAAVFHPTGDRQASRNRIAALRELPPDSFIVLNANRNEPRKRIDITREGFARFAADKPANVFLHLHDGRGLDDAELNHLYNACDVGLNTASAEGWGMISFEHAATGAAQIVPGGWVCGETWGENAELLDVAAEPDDGSRYTRAMTPSAQSVADALERLYRDPEHRAVMAGRAMAFANRPEFQWKGVAARWDALLRELCAAAGLTRPSITGTSR